MRNNPVLYDLAQLLDAGIAPAEATSRLLGGHKDDGGSLARLGSELKRGRSLGSALHASGFATNLETEILQAAEHAGKLVEALRLVANNFEQRRNRAASLRVRLLLPTLVVFVALAIGVVRSVTGGADFLPSLLIAFGIAFAVFLASRALLAGVARDGSHWLSLGWRLGLHRRSALFRQFFEQTFYTLLVWQAEAGVDPVSAAKNLGTLVNAPTYRTAINHYRRTITNGGAMYDALEESGLMVAGELAQVINVGERAGRLAAALRHYLNSQEERLAIVTDRIYTWLPRIYYLVVIAIGGASII